MFPEVWYQACVQFWPRYCWHLTPPMVISHQKSGRTSLIRISRPLLNHHSPRKAWLLKYQCQDLSDKEGWATAGNIYTTSNRPETGKKRDSSDANTSSISSLVSQLVKSLGRHRVKKLFRWRRDSAIIQETFPAQNGWHLIIASRIIRCVSFSYYKLRMGRTLATLCVGRSIDQKSLLPERNQIWQQETCLVIRNCDIPIREGVRKTFVRT